MNHKYAINFDLHTDRESEKELRDIIGISLSKMYDIIEKHLLNNGFEWVQGSGYITKEAISSFQLTTILKQLYRKNDWLGHFTRDIKRTIVNEETYSYDSMLKYYEKKFNDKYHNKKNNNEKDFKHEPSDIEWAKETLKKYEKENNSAPKDESNQKSSEVENKHDGRD